MPHKQDQSNNDENGNCISVMRRQIFHERDARDSGVRVTVHAVHTREQFLFIQACSAIGLCAGRREIASCIRRQPLSPIMDSDFHAVLKRIQRDVNPVLPDSALGHRFAANIPRSLGQFGVRRTLEACARRLMRYSGTKHANQSRVLVHVEDGPYRINAHWIGPH
jgi:hypothetical protein